MLAEAWCCSERHIRNLVAAGQLRGFRLGGKLLRIPQDAVQEFMQCQNTASDGSTDGSASPGGETESGTVTRLEPLARARLNGLRQRSTPS
jgi:excisionase family DNA binding protein